MANWLMLWQQRTRREQRLLIGMGLLLAVGMLVDNAVVVVESIYQEREKYPGQPRLASIVGTRHVAIALSAGTLCHCVVFLPMMFGEKNIITIYLSQLAVTISFSLLGWLPIRGSCGQLLV